MQKSVARSLAGQAFCVDRVLVADVNKRLLTPGVWKAEQRRYAGARPAGTIRLRRPSICRFILCGLVLSYLAGCAASGQDFRTLPPSGQDLRVAENQVVMPAPERAPSCDVTELVELWKRRKAKGSGDFAIGAGDVIAISVPEIDELQKQEVRVSSDGTIGLSLIGTMKVSGMDENDLRDAIVRRLGRFMKYPRVDLFVERYQAREVFVSGAVQKPGRYDLANLDQSITDMIGRAGGMTADAAQKVIFVPAKFKREPPAGLDGTGLAPPPTRVSLRHAPNDLFDLKDDSEVPRNVTNEELRARSWIAMDLANPQNRACLALPTRPGDVIIIPIAGEVMVQGWVGKPGAFKITPGMTVLGAVSAAGGAPYDASAEVLRTDSAGRHVAARFDLSSLAAGEQADIPLQSGDVIAVEPSLIGAVPFALSQILNHFGAGLFVPVP